MVVRVHKLRPDGERYQSYRNILRVTKVEERDNILYVHTYFSDSGLAKVKEIDLDKNGVDIFVGRY